MKKARCRNIAMYVAGVLLILTLVSTSIVSGLFAQYTSSDSGSDLARVAKFAVTGTGFSQTFNLQAKMKPGDVLNYTETGDDHRGAFEISNQSEVTVQYTLTIRNTTNNLPLALKVKLNGAEVDKSTEFTSADGYTYSTTLAPNGTAAEKCEFKIEWPAASNDLVYSGQLDNIAITVKAIQVD